MSKLIFFICKNMSTSIQLIPVNAWQIKAAKAGSLSKLLLPMQGYTETDLTGSESVAGSAVQDGDGNWILSPSSFKKGQEAQTVEIPFKCGDFIQLQERAWDNKLLAPMPDKFLIKSVHVKQFKDLQYSYSDSASKTIHETSRFWELSNPDYPLASFRWIIQLSIALIKK